MTEPNIRIKGAERVGAFFGKWPSFHDAEVVKIEMDRQGPHAIVQLYAFETTSEVDSKGYYKQTKHCLITFKLAHIESLELSGFNAQNVISDLLFQQEGNSIKVSLEPCYGVSGEITCREVEVVEVEPVHPRDQGVRGPARPI